MFRTEYEFVLPHGYLDDDGEVHREGVMRLATAADEILPLKDPRVQKNPAYLVIIVLSRVLARLGSLDAVTTKTIENLFVADLAFLQRLYNEINRLDADGPGEAVLNGGVERAAVPGGILGYPVALLIDEVAFVSYHFHWSHAEVMNLEHAEPRQWVAAISAINERMNAE